MVRIEGVSRANFGCSILMNGGKKMIEKCRSGKIDLYSHDGHLWYQNIIHKCLYCSECKEYEILKLRGVKMAKNEEENLNNKVVYWKAVIITLHSQETRRFGSLSSARDYVTNYTAQQAADYKIFKVTEEEIE